MKFAFRSLSTKIIISVAALFFAVGVFAIPRISAGGPAGVVKFFFIDRQDYAASGSIIILRNEEDGTQTNVSSEYFLNGHVPQGHLLFDKLTPDCSGNLTFYLGTLDYEIRWVHENNLYPNAQIISTDFLEDDLSTRVDLRVNNGSNQNEYNASLLVEGFDRDGNGTVTDAELEESRYWFDQNCGEGPIAYYGPTPSPTSTLAPTATNTPSPTNTPTPSPAPVPFEQIGLKNIDPVEVTVAQGTTSYTYIQKIESITATQFSNYGYPTPFGPGISMNPSTAGISPGTSTNLTLYVNGNVPLGTYFGYQIVKTNVSGAYSQYFVKVHVVELVPTATPTMTPTKTPTSTPVPTLEISNVAHSNVTMSSAIITWETNIPATTQVVYGTSSRKMKQTPEMQLMTSNHTMSLTGLSGGKTYYYYAVSRDATGKTVVTATRSFKTPRR